jgi:hypothetical protein
MNLDFGSNKASEQVVKEFNSRMDKLEKQSEDKSNDEAKSENTSENTTDGSQTEQQ